MEKISILNNFWFLAIFVIWSLLWKGIALWKSARRNEFGWFLALLILNTLGILEIIYLFLIIKRKDIETPNGEQANGLARKRIV